MKAPGGMAPETWTRISKLPADVRDRVLERASILYYGGAVKTLAEADERALAEEGITTQQAIGGVT